MFHPHAGKMGTSERFDSPKQSNIYPGPGAYMV
jgi:hypothetical protein